MTTATENQAKNLPPPWDRIFSLGTRLFVWALLATIVYILRPFFLLIFLTFVFAYIQAHGVDGLQQRLANRPLRVVIVGLVFLGTILATGFTLAPQVADQTQKFLNDLPAQIEKADEYIEKWLKERPAIGKFLGRDTKPPKEGDPVAEPVKPVSTLIATVLGFADDDASAATGAQTPKKVMEKQLKKALDLGNSVLGYAGSFLLAILFSFLIVLDLQRIRRGITSLADTRLGFIYDEVAEGLAAFGTVLGRALEAQLFIAVCNTVLTAIGVWMMGLPNILVLSSIVFLCSFIPVVGTFVSSTPICLLALLNGGFGMMFLAIGLILLIHGIETYILNPQIYGHHMRMNPVFVLIVLTVAGKLVGVWGLVLGIPIVNYFFRHVIQRRPAPDALPVRPA